MLFLNVTFLDKVLLAASQGNDKRSRTKQECLVIILGLKSLLKTISKIA